MTNARQTKAAPSAPELTHLEGCPHSDGQRVERYALADTDSRAVGVTRCTTCGEARYDRTAVETDENGRSETAAALLAGDERYVELWQSDPGAVYRGLTADERRDPRLNPQHQFAESEPPGVRIKRTIA